MLLATGWKTSHVDSVHFFKIASISQEAAFDEVNKHIVDNKAAFDLLLVKRRSLMEEWVKYLTPIKAFDMHL